MSTSARRAEPIRRLIIVGGGSAGWMTAAACAQTTLGGCEIVVVESEEIGIVGVGEATIPAIKAFNAFLGIDEREFMVATQGSYKLGIQFVDWRRHGHAYFHPFGSYGANFDWTPLFQYFLQARAHGDTTDLQDYSLCWLAAKGNRFTMPERNQRTAQSTIDYAYHFDAVAYGRFLRQYAEERGVTRIEGRIVNVDTGAVDGNVTGLTLEDGRRIEGDFFIDCTGFKGLLIEEALNTGYDNWSEYLPCDRAAAVPCALAGDFTPYTRATARAAGWQWRIPLQHRIGNGYVHCSDLIGETEAVETLLTNLDGAPLADPRIIRFTTGRRRKAWNKNVLAIGLSAGFMEPLESTSLHLIQTGIMRFVALFPGREAEPHRAAEYNRLTAEEWERVRDFLILHYNATERRDSELWRRSAAMTIPDSLAWRLEMFRATGEVPSPGPEVFTEVNWISVLMGQGIEPERYSPLADMRGVNGPEYLAKVRSVLQSAASRMDTHADFIRKHRSAPQAPVAAPAV